MLSRILLRRRLHHHHRRHHYHTNQSPTATPTAAEIPLSHPIYQIWSSNTSLGKTLVSTGIASSFLLSPPSLSPSPSSSSSFIYLKPIQTGYPSDSDSSFLYSKLNSLSRLRNLPISASHSILYSSAAAAKCGYDKPLTSPLQGIVDLGFSETDRITDNTGRRLLCKTLFAWEEAVSPHLAAEREKALVEDSVVVEMLGRCLREGVETGEKDVFCIVETAGGVASPGPSGTLQCDLYRPFRLPGILIGDGRLGGISSTISAFESLKLRGYDIDAVVLEDHGLFNEASLMSYLRKRVPVLVLPSIPKDLSDDLVDWFGESQNTFNSLKEVMLSAYVERKQRLNSMQKKAGDILWWPFTQHKLVPEQSVTVIDSRCGENFSVFKAQSSEYITQQFDACASWWTQGPDATFQTELARDMGYAAARYGHVMFPENVYEPALQCAELLLQGVGKGWASRTYFSDNGSTAIEIALKMAFRKFSFDHALQLVFPNNGRAEKHIELKVLALRGSYHGDTLGAMEAQAPSSYTGFLQQPWYTGRGIFLSPPTVYMSNGIWNLSLFEGLLSDDQQFEDLTFSSRDEIFDKRRDESKLAALYSSFISEQIQQNSGSNGKGHIGALLIEPVIQGAGGMLMVDPLYQRVLVNECRKHKIPTIFDEVFTGFWRLGAESAAELLGSVPDIACYAKLMTGGIIPLAATLATEDIFNSFIGDTKLMALLHGHSYSAHAMGCTAGAKSIKWFKNPLTNSNITDQRSLRELWDPEMVQQVSSHPAVQRVVALGTLCALELQAEGSNAGYGSVYASSLIQKLRDDGVYMRPLGNVIYLMCGPCTLPKTCRQVLTKVYKRLDEFHQTRN